MKEDLKSLKKWAREQVEEQMRYMTRKMDKEEQDYVEAKYAYKKTFGRGFPADTDRSQEEATARMWRHIEEGKPYVSNLPKGAII